MTNDMRLHDPYEDQLSAARYRAERDVAIQERDRLEKEVERLRYVDRDCAMLRGAVERIADVFGIVLGEDLTWCAGEMASAAERLSRRLMPPGMEWLLEVWPKWSNGEYCKFGDWWTADKYGDYEPKQLRRLAFFTPEQLREWGQDEADNFGYEWDFMRPSDTTYRPDKAEPPAPPDSWERLDEDAEKNPFDYCKDVGHRLDTCENAERYKSRDLVRRAKALAERGE